MSEAVIKQPCTSCKDCAFASYEGNTQSGCEAGAADRLEKVDAYDEEKEFWVISGRQCPMYRSKSSRWAARNEGRWLEQARADNRLRCAVVVPCDGRDAVRTAVSLLASSLPPSEVVFVQAPGDSTDLRTALSPVLKSHFPWRVQKVLWYEEKYPLRGQLVDRAVSQCTSQYYCVVPAGAELPPGYLAALDREMNEELKRVALVEPYPDGSCMVVKVDCHRHPDVAGHTAVEYDLEGGTVLLTSPADKLRRVAPEEADFFLSAGELCPR